MRCHAYQLPASAYRQLETQILEAVATADREQLLFLLADQREELQLLSGAWRVLFAAAETEFYQYVNAERRRARMAVSPDEMSDFAALLNDPEFGATWAPVDFSLVELADSIPEDEEEADIGIVFVEESDNWLWTPPNYEIHAIAPDVYSLLEPHMRELIDEEDFHSLARLCADHCEAVVEFSPQRWKTLRQQVTEQVPELIPAISRVLTPPDDYTSMSEALRLIATPTLQPSLDAWLRVHGDGQQYALYFRDIGREAAEEEPT
ncbi:MAG: hypothetical protein B7733_25110 [Myxococcales bacterium FL481]|nr:MAG: hypothetical protein B7733_25110 [Myxococcales bacterium FL481]